jgi:hypothetical protein
LLTRNARTGTPSSSIIKWIFTTRRVRNISIHTRSDVNLSLLLLRFGGRHQNSVFICKSKHGYCGFARHNLGSSSKHYCAASSSNTPLKKYAPQITCLRC